MAVPFEGLAIVRPKNVSERPDVSHAQEGDRSGSSPLQSRIGMVR
jgi:hypothetical protein